MSLGSLRWDDLQPQHLVRVRKRVVEQHPGTASAPVPLTDGELAQLHGRVEAASGSDAALASLAAELNPREVRALVTGIQQWESLRQDVAVLLSLRSRAGLVAPLWRAWQRFPRVNEIRELLLGMCEHWGWETIASVECPAEVVSAWVRSQTPGRALQQWLGAQGYSYSDLAAASGNSLLPGTPLDRLVREAVMTDGWHAQLRREGAGQIAEWERELSPELHLRFGQNLLMKLGVQPEYRTTLEKLADRYGLPRRPKVARFWEPIDETTKLAFQRLFIRKRIRELFQSDIDRRDYWEKWTDELVDVQRDAVQGTEYGLLDFGKFGVVEFFENGNAAYFYDEERFKKVSARHVTDRRDLRIRYTPVFARWGDNRLIHSPSQRGWYSRADTIMQRWMAATRGR